MEANGLDPLVLQTAFDTYWPQFESKFQSIIETVPAEQQIPPRGDSDILAEILDNTRQLSARVSKIDHGQVRTEPRESSKAYPISDDDIRFIREMVEQQVPDAVIRVKMQRRNVPRSFVNALINSVRNELQNRELVDDPSVTGT
jgi:hypothetical protein